MQGFDALSLPSALVDLGSLCTSARWATVRCRRHGKRCCRRGGRSCGHGAWPVSSRVAPPQQHHRKCLQLTRGQLYKVRLLVGASASAGWRSCAGGRCDGTRRRRRQWLGRRFPVPPSDSCLNLLLRYCVRYCMRGVPLVASWLSRGLAGSAVVSPQGTPSSHTFETRRRESSQSELRRLSLPDGPEITAVALRAFTVPGVRTVMPLDAALHVVNRFRGRGRA